MSCLEASCRQVKETVDSSRESHVDHGWWAFLGLESVPVAAISRRAMYQECLEQAYFKQEPHGKFKHGLLPYAYKSTASTYIVRHRPEHEAILMIIIVSFMFSFDLEAAAPACGHCMVPHGFACHGTHPHLVVDGVHYRESTSDASSICFWFAGGFNRIGLFTVVHWPP